MTRTGEREKRSAAPRLPEIRLQLSRLVLEQRPDDFGRALAGGEHGVAGQVERRVLFVRAGLGFQRLLGLAVDDAADARPVDRAGAHRARLGRSVERAAREERNVVGARRARSEQPLGMGGAVAALARVSVALLHQELAVTVGERRAKRVVACGARAARDVEGAPQQRLVIGARCRLHRGGQRILPGYNSEALERLGSSQKDTKSGFFFSHSGYCDSF
jgi:hypothetical protein